MSTFKVPSGGTSGYVAAQDEGSALISRATLNFTGAGVTATDDSSNARTNVAIPGAEVLVHAVGNSGSSLTLDAAASSGYVKTVTLNANCTFTLTGATSGKVATLELELTQDGTGSRTVTWPASVKWPAGIAPVLSTAAGAVDVVVLTSRNAGTTWQGNLVGKAYA